MNALKLYFNQKVNEDSMRHPIPLVFFVPALIAALIMTWAAAGFAAQPEPIPSLIQSIRFKDNIVFCNRPVPVSDQGVKAMLEKEMLLALWNRPQVILWIKRAARYFPHIEAVLSAEQLPDDLKYVPVVESALRPHARSSAGAVGYWQFLRSTGKRYGLRIDSQVDERRNLLKSTRAACRYMKKLHARFGDYSLALAAYNMGEHGLSVAMDAQQTKNFFDLYLPSETQRYLFKIIAAKLILEAPQKYGFILDKTDLYPRFAFSRLTFNSQTEIPLVIIARAAGLSFKTLREMNPELRDDTLAKGPATVLVPPGTEKGFQKKFDKLFSAWNANTHTRFHVVKPGESLNGIAQKYSISLAALLRLNKFSYKKVIHPGDRVRVR